MNQTAISRAIADHGVAVGCMLFEFDTPRVMRLLAAAGVDFALFDLEHTAWDAESLRRTLAAGRATGIHTVTRVVRAQYPLVATALDAGSRGVMAPMVESADEARVLVESSRYPPLGRRGFGVVMSDELEGGPAAAADRSNRDTFVIAQIESEAGIEHADEILSVPGIDAAWVGQFDLSLSLGCPGDFEHERYVEAVDGLLQACRRHETPLGQLVASAEAGAAAAAQGFQLVAFADVWVFEQSLRAGVAALRRESPGR
ncbi:MAG TPA: aldolase/citrate lyase family protein [Gaiellales bacterium]|nr:aldolase/citrate lyase family protein [Gaiellales bacterium]